jgi:hypothetical protein
MGSIIIKSPNSDDIWEKWKQKNIKKEKLAKNFGVKGAQFKLEDVTGTKYVKKVTEAAVIYLEKSKDIQKSKAKPKSQTTDTRGLLKTKFYTFAGSPIKDQWKGGNEAPYVNSINGVTCTKCAGVGGLKCKQCKGAKIISCPDCGGKKNPCRKCAGTGKLSAEITVINHKGEKSKKPKSVQCSSCYGDGKSECSRCGGSGKVPCKYCGSKGLGVCPTCDGYGIMYSYEIKPVPFKSQSDAIPVILASVKISSVEKEMGVEIHKAIEKVGGIALKSPKKELTPKFINPTLGYMDGGIKKIISKAEKEWANAAKDGDINIGLPIYVFPLIVLDCETNKGKKFQVYSIGSDKNFMVFGSI